MNACWSEMKIDLPPIFIRAWLTVCIFAPIFFLSHFTENESRAKRNAHFQFYRSMCTNSWPQTIYFERLKRNLKQNPQRNVHCCVAMNKRSNEKKKITSKQMNKSTAIFSMEWCVEKNSAAQLHTVYAYSCVFSPFCHDQFNNDSFLRLMPTKMCKSNASGMRSNTKSHSQLAFANWPN